MEQIQQAHLSNKINKRIINPFYNWLHNNSYTNLSYRKINKIITYCNYEILKSILQGNTITLPYKFGKLYFIEEEVNNYKKLVRSYKTDWKTTAQLWEEDNESKKNMIIVRKDEKRRKLLKLIWDKDKNCNSNLHLFYFKLSLNSLSYLLKILSFLGPFKLR